jgi:dephospho-CoA kinase
MKLGLTGGIATGKSTVSTMFKEAGIPVIDTDKIARDVVQKGTEAYREICAYFSDEILLTNGEISRKKLGQIIFANTKKREKLNSIVHPKVEEIVESELEKFHALDVPIIVIDVPLLFESNFEEMVDKTIVVFTSQKEQVKRLMERDHIDKEYALMKIKAQMPLSDKVDMADYVINNSFSILQTKKDFNKMMSDLGVS